MKKHLFCLALLTLTFIGNSQEFKRMSSVEEQVEDFTIFKTTLLECHSGIYAYNDSLSLFRHLSEMEAELTAKPLTKIAQLAIYSKFITSIKCIHSGVYHTKMLQNTLKSRFEFPFQVYFLKNELRSVEKAAMGEIEIDQNDRILSINGESVSDIKDSLYLLIPSDGNNITRKNEILRNRFLYYYFLYRQSESNFEIEYIHQNDTVKRMINSCYYVNQKQQKTKKNDVIQFSIDTLKNTAILTLTKPLRTNKEYNESLITFMTNIKDLKIQNLILDLRNNGGGKSQNYFAGFFIDSNIEYQLMESRSLHIATYKKYFKHKLSLQFLLSNLKGRLSQQQESLQYVKPQVQYEGNLFILVNGNTASAASNLASILKEWSNALVIGEETGGGYKTYNTGGGTLQLPNSKIRIGIRTLKGTVNVCNEYDNDGVIPNFTVSEGDYFKRNGDEQLNFILDKLIPKKPYLTK